MFSFHFKIFILIFHTATRRFLFIFFPCQNFFTHEHFANFFSNLWIFVSATKLQIVWTQTQRRNGRRSHPSDSVLCIAILHNNYTFGMMRGKFRVKTLPYSEWWNTIQFGSTHFCLLVFLFAFIGIVGTVFDAQWIIFDEIAEYGIGVDNWIEQYYDIHCHQIILQFWKLARFAQYFWYLQPYRCHWVSILHYCNENHLESTIIFKLRSNLRLVIMYLILPETEGCTLEDIEIHFSDNNRKLTDRRIARRSEDKLKEIS